MGELNYKKGGERMQRTKLSAFKNTITSAIRGILVIAQIIDENQDHILKRCTSAKNKRVRVKVKDEKEMIGLLTDSGPGYIELTPDDSTVMRRINSDMVIYVEEVCDVNIEEESTS